MFGMWDVWDVDVGDVECSGCGMRDEGCLPGYGIFKVFTKAKQKWKPTN